MTGPAAGRVIWTRSEFPHFASNGQVLAVEGVEIVSTFGPAGTVRRNRLFSRHTSDIAVTRDGDVLTTGADGISLIHPS